MNNNSGRCGRENDDTSLTSGASGSMPSAGEVLLALADRCEREEPSRELDEAIARGLGYEPSFRAGDETHFYAPNRRSWPATTSAPRWTTSLDSAVTLVPEGCDYMARARHKFNSGVELGADWAERHPPKSSARVWKMANAGLYTVRVGSDAATPIAALCAASLRARAALVQS